MNRTITRIALHALAVVIVAATVTIIETQATEQPVKCCVHPLHQRAIDWTEPT